MVASLNRLSESTSPYLLQHADNPVHWWPWCDEALELAATTDRPILLSIGYSACHWCHVMAHESFEDEETARVMNELFVNIKVDREERPDLDKIYQLAHQVLTRRGGGWPLTVFLAPDTRLPFFAGTYFPRETRYGMPSFKSLLERIAAAWRDQRSELEQQNRQMQEFLAGVAAPRGDDELPDATLAGQALAQLSQQFDPEHGGFGGAPKFPNPSNLRFLLRWPFAGDDRARAQEMALTTLARMAAGGIHDHLAGGFCRYSVDAQWMIPHFEKMAYDNAQLLPLYALAWRVSGDQWFREAATGIVDWVLADLQGEDGGYYSSYDADSEGEEGRYYIWTPDQVEALLSAEEYAAFAPRFGLDRPPNFEQQAWHLHAFRSIEDVAAKLGIPAAEVRARIAGARRKLLAERATRVPPGRDDKTLCSWNALMIEGMAVAARNLDDERLLVSARRALDYLRATLWDGERLLAVARDGKARLNAYLDDHAFLLLALMELLATDWRDADLDFAVTLADALIERFADSEGGGFFFTSHDHEALIQRPKPFQDDAIPSGNAVAAEALLRLGHLLAEPRYLGAAEGALRGAGPELRRFPHAYCASLCALADALDPSRLLILRGEIAAEQRNALTRKLSPRDALYRVAGALETRYPLKGGFTAYLCQGLSCSAPIESLGELERALDGGVAADG